MKRRTITMCAAALAAALAGRAAAADAEEGAMEARLREALKSTTLQLRTVQGEKDALAAAQAQLEADKKTLEDRVAVFTKNAAADKASIDGLTEKLADRDARVAKLEAAVRQWRSEAEKQGALAKKTEAERLKLADEGLGLKRRVADLEAKNLALYSTGTEVLGRYEKFGLGTALAAREPFVGITRVKFQNLVQGYQDKLIEQKDRP
jgi:chromosome segregation ATPase